MALKYVQTLTLYQAGAGNIIGATSVVLTTLTDIYGNAITSMAPFGTKGYITLEPDTTNEEGATFTGVTPNANGTTTLTGISTILAQSPYTETSGLVRNHAGGSKVVVTDNVAFWNTFANTQNANTFTVLPQSAATPVNAADFATKAYVDATAVAGAPNATTTVKGIVQEATQAQVLAKTQAGSTGADLYVNPATLPSTLLSDYKVDTGTANVYVITPTPAITAYVVGQQFSFKAVNANTGASTLNINGLGVHTIKNQKSGDLVANDILAGQVVVVEYDGTNFQMVSPLGNTISSTGTGAYPAGDGSALTNLVASKVINTLTAGPALTAGQALVVGPYQSDGGILIDTTGTVTSNSSSVTVGVHANRVFVVMATTATGGAVVTGASYGGVSMTLVDGPLAQASRGSMSTFILVAPATGSNTLAFTLSSGTAQAIYYSLYGAAQTTTPDAHAGASASTNVSASITTVASGALVIGAAGSNSNFLNGAAYTYNLQNASSAIFSGNSGQVFTSGSTVAINAGNSSNISAAAVMSITPFTAPATAVQPASSATPTNNQYNNLYAGFIGFANASVLAGASIAVITGGVVTGLSGLISGSQYYLNDTIGTIGTGSGTNTRKAGIATSATTLVVTNIW